MGMVNQARTYGCTHTSNLLEVFMKRRIIWVGAASAALSLSLVGTALAAGTSPKVDHHSHFGKLGSQFGWSFGRGDAPLGSVTSLVGDTLTVLEFDGVSQTFTVGTSTKYFLDGKATTSAAVTAGLNVVVDAPHYWAGGSSTTTPAAAIVFLISPNVLGNIQSVTVGTSGDTINVLNPQGFAFTIQTSSTTTFWVDGTSSTTAPTFTDGEIIAALGTVNTSSRDELDATQVNVIPLHHHS